MSDNKTLIDQVAECMIDDAWQEWLKKYMSEEEWDQHIHGVRTLIKTHDKNVVQIVRAFGNDYISLGYWRFTLRLV